jgi:hypothetical protein
MTWDPPKLRPDELARSARYAAAVTECRAMRWSARASELVPCAKEKAGEWRSLPLCLEHLEPAGAGWMKRQRRYERKVGLGLWLAARAGNAADLLRPVCPTCGCGKGRSCELVLPADLGRATCSPAGAVGESCSACYPAMRGAAAVLRPWAVSPLPRPPPRDAAPWSPPVLPDAARRVT